MKDKAIRRSNPARGSRDIGDSTGRALDRGRPTTLIKRIASRSVQAPAVVVPSGSADANALKRQFYERPCALIVDDDPEVRRALQRALGPELEVHMAGTVAQGAAVLNRLGRVDLALVDLDLPDDSGERILERLTPWPDAIRVLISGRVLTNENPLTNRSLVNLVLCKPLAPLAIEALKRAALGLPID